jgi:calcineurin-like phosphoesterase family protein
MNTFFTSDTHLRHSAIIRFCSRPFSSLEEMDETIIRNWNAKVKPEDRVYHLGDFCFGNREEILKMTRRLHGHIIIIEGNHDEIGDPKSYGFASKHQMLEIKLNGTYITLCHYAMRVWNKSHFDSWLLYGHSHGTLMAPCRPRASPGMWGSIVTILNPWSSRKSKRSWILDRIT